MVHWLRLNARVTALKFSRIILKCTHNTIFLCKSSAISLTVHINPASTQESILARLSESLSSVVYLGIILSVSFEKLFHFYLKPCRHKHVGELCVRVAKHAECKSHRSGNNDIRQLATFACHSAPLQDHQPLFITTRYLRTQFHFFPFFNLLN